MKTRTEHIRRTQQDGRVAISGGLLVGLLTIGSCTQQTKINQERTGTGLSIASKGGLDGYPEQNPAATRAYINKLNFAWNAPRDSMVDTVISCHPGACGGQSSIHIRIVPERDAYKYDVGAALATSSSGGYFLARVVNIDTVQYTTLKLLPRDTAFLWAGLMSNGQKRFALFRVPGGSLPVTRIATATRAGWCMPVSPVPPRTIAATHIAEPHCQINSFYAANPTAIRLAHRDDWALREFLSGSWLREGKPMGHDSGLWVSCSLGCCEATALM